MKLSFRPHHFLCTLGFQGKGYSPAFVKNYFKIVETLEENESLALEVVTTSDSICQPCPHRVENGCSRDEMIRSLDRRHATVLELQEGDSLTWSEAKEKLKDKMTLKAFHQACEGCSWKPLGMCEAALLKLHASP